MGTNLPHIILQPLLQNPGYETKDLTNVCMFHFTPDALLARADSAFENVAQVIEAAHATPGALTVGVRPPSRPTTSPISLFPD